MRGWSPSPSPAAASIVDQVLLAIGRHPNTAGIGLEQAGVKLDAGGAIEVDAYSRTSADNIYAVGDVTNRLQFTPVAIREGAAFVQTVFDDQADGASTTTTCR